MLATTVTTTSLSVPPLVAPRLRPLPAALVQWPAGDPVDEDLGLAPPRRPRRRDHLLGHRPSDIVERQCHRVQYASEPGMRFPHVVLGRCKPGATPHRSEDWPGDRRHGRRVEVHDVDVPGHPAQPDRPPRVPHPTVAGQEVHGDIQSLQLGHEVPLPGQEVADLVMHGVRVGDRRHGDEQPLRSPRAESLHHVKHTYRPGAPHHGDTLTVAAHARIIREADHAA